MRTLVMLARAILVIWLGAIRENSKPAIQELVPWVLENIGYRGFAGYGSMAKDIIDPAETRQRRTKLVE